MTPAPSPGQPKVIDLTGLPDSAVRAVENLVEALRRQAAQPNVLARFGSREEWVKAIRTWASNHPPPAVSADWDRDRIYSGRGE